MEQSNGFDQNIWSTGFLTVNVPGAGVECTFTNNTGGLARVNYLHFRLTAAAVAANRVVQVNLLRSGFIRLIGCCDIFHTLGQVKSYVAAFGLPLQVQDRADIFYIPLPRDIILEPGDVLATVTKSINAGDQYDRLLAECCVWLPEIT